MWLVALFDLPVVTPKDRRHYARFRKALLKDGFIMLQYSVYARYCASEEGSETHRKRVRESCPDEGEVRLLAVTDHQYAKMEVYVGAKREPTEQPPVQLEFF
jgi:CRISPR-associated protein Cas2